MRVAFLKSYLLWAYATGGERTHVAWLRYLSDAGHEVLMRYAVPAAFPDFVMKRLLSVIRRYGFPVVAINDRHIVYRAAGITIETIRVNGPPASWILSWLDDLKPDIVMGILKDTALAPLLPAAWSGRGFLLVEDSATVATLKRTLTPEARDRFRNSRLSLVASSEFLRSRMAERLDLSAEVVYPPVDMQPTSLTVDTDAPITMFGTTAEKGFDIFQEIARRMPARRFRTVTGWNESEQALTVGNLQYVPFVADPTEIYSSSGIVLVPSRVPEGFGRVALEAMAMGRAVIVSDSGALPEVVGDAGIVIPSGGPKAACTEWIEALNTLADAALLGERTEAGLTRARELRRTSIRQLEELLQSTLPSRR
jgi:glycosyltransferase involved in cell wall biosynthesis